MQLRSGRRDLDPSKDRPPIPHFIVSAARGPEVSKVRSLTGLCGLRVTVETYVPPKGPLQCRRCQHFDHTQRNCGHGPRCVACGGLHLSGDCPASRGQPQCCSCGGDHTANYRGCAKWKEARAALAGRTPERGHKKNVAMSKPAAPKARQPQPSAEQMDLSGGWSHVVRGRRVVRANIPPTPKPITKLITKAPKQLKVIAAAKMAKPEKAEPKITAAPKATVKPKKAATTGTKPVVTAPPVAHHHPTPSPLEGISDLIDQLPFDACVELTRRLLTAIPSLPKGAARPRAVLKTVILFVAEYGSSP